MSTHRSSSLIIDGGISLSFREELATTIHGAFEIAVEIVVLEITKLVDQALGDVHEQMSETLRENKSLKLLLKAAEQKLESLSGSVKCESSGQLTTVESSSESCRHQHSREDSDGSKSDQETKQNKQNSSSLNKADEGLEENFIHEAETCSERLNESFDEIREDGRVCSYDINATHEDPKQDSSSSFSDSQMNPGSVDSEPDAEGDDDETPVQPKAEHFHVKEERSDLELGQGAGAEAGPSPGCSFDSAADDEFGSDSLALAQSKMLEDWRPDPQPKENETDPQQPGPSHTLETSDLSSSIGGLPVFPAPFPGLYQSGDRTALSHPSPQHYNVHIRTNFTPNMHVCKICGQSFHRQSDLKRHHSQQHRSGPANQNPFSGSIRTPKRQMFPPGQSPYHCTECGRDFNRMENLKTHLRIHTGERPYSCSVCGVRFRHSGALTRHFRIHTGEKPYVCGECGKTFRNCGGLRLHQRSHNRERGEMF